MDEKKVSKAIDRVLESPELLTLAAEEMARNQSDSDAAEFGIERLTLVTASEKEILIVKPSDMLGEFWLLNLFGAGTLSINNPDFELTSIAGEVFRLSIKAENLNYWVDLKNEYHIKKASEFLGVELN